MLLSVLVLRIGHLWYLAGLQCIKRITHMCVANASILTAALQPNEGNGDHLSSGVIWDRTNHLSSFFDPGLKLRVVKRRELPKSVRICSRWVSF